MTGHDHNPSCTAMVSDTEETVVKCFTCHNHPVSLLTLVMDIRRRNKNDYRRDYDFGMIMDLVDEEEKHLPDFEDLPDFESEKEPQFIQFSEEWLKSFFPAAAHPYLKKRGISPLVSERLGVVLDPTEFRVCFPVRDWQGRLAGLHGRDTTGINQLRYFAYKYNGHVNTSVWLGEDACDLSLPVVLTEGPFDLAKIKMSYDNVLASLTSALSVKKLKRLVEVEEVISFYDYGTGGDHARDKLDSFCSKRSIPLTHIIPTQEVGDAGNMIPQEIYALITPILC